MRQRILRVDLRNLVGLFMHGCPALRVVRDALPPGTELVRVFVNEAEAPGFVSLVVAHPSFEEVRPGEIIPSAPHPLFEQLHPVRAERGERQEEPREPHRSA